MSEIYLASRPILALRLNDAFYGRLGADSKPSRAFGEIQITVTHDRSDGIARPLDAPITLDVVRNKSGDYISFNRVTGPDNVERAPAFPAGRYDLCIHAQFYRSQVVSDVPFAGMPPSRSLAAARSQQEAAAPSLVVVELEPGYAYPFPALRYRNGAWSPTLLRGVVDPGADDADGFQIDLPTLPEVAPYITDSSGQWLLLLAEDQKDTRLDLRVTDPDGGVKTVRGIDVAAAKATTVPPIVVSDGANA